MSGEQVSDDDSDEEEEEANEPEEEEEDPDEMEVGDQFKYNYKKHWGKYRNNLLAAPYIRAAYMLSPNPVIQQHVKDNPDPEDRLAVECLLVKLFVTDYVQDDEESEQKKAAVLDKFWDEYGEFANHTGMFKGRHIWISAEHQGTFAHKWHERYSYPYTEYLGKLACRVTSKVMGIGEAERIWKAVKKIRVGQRGSLTPEKAKKQAIIAASYSMEKSKARRQRYNTAGRLWTDEDFETCMLGEKMVFLIVLTAMSLSQLSSQLFNRRVLQWCCSGKAPTPQEDIQGLAGGLGIPFVQKSVKRF